MRYFVLFIKRKLIQNQKIKRGFGWLFILIGIINIIIGFAPLTGIEGKFILFAIGFIILGILLVNLLNTPKNKILGMKQLDNNNNNQPNCDNNEIEQNVEVLEFYDTIVSILSKAGFYTITEKDRIFFEYENVRYVIHIDNVHDLGISCNILNFKEEEALFFLTYINQMNWNYKFSRFLINDEKTIIARIVYPVNDSTNVSSCFWNIVRALISSIRDFHNGLNSNK